MFDILVSMFSYSYGIRAIVVGILVALCASLLGVSLILKKYAMVGDGLSHVGFGSWKERYVRKKKMYRNIIGTVFHG